MSVCAAVLAAPDSVHLRNFPFSEISDNDGPLMVEMVGICSTDVKLFYGAVDNYTLPLILGHESVKRIERPLAQPWPQGKDANWASA